MAVLASEGQQQDQGGEGQPAGSQTGDVLQPSARSWRTALTREHVQRWAAVVALAAFSFWLGTRFSGGLPFGDGPAVRLTTWAPAPVAPSFPAQSSPTSAGTHRRAHRSGGTRASRGTALTGVNINSATVDDLRRALHVRRSTAERIVAYRRRHGPFTSLDDLLAVPLSRSTITRIGPYITFR